MNDFFKKFGLIYEFSTVDDRCAIHGVSTPWFNLYKNHNEQWVITHWSWEKDYILNYRLIKNKGQ